MLKVYKEQQSIAIINHPISSDESGLTFFGSTEVLDPSTNIKVV